LGELSPNSPVVFRHIILPRLLRNDTPSPSAIGVPLTFWKKQFFRPYLDRVICFLETG
jgi:hypothetical protein